MYGVHGIYCIEINSEVNVTCSYWLRVDKRTETEFNGA